MFFAVNQKNVKNIEKEAINQFQHSIKLASFTEVTMVDLVKSDELGKDIQKIVIDFYLNGDKMGYKKRIKVVKDLYSKHGLEKLLLAFFEPS